MAPATSQSALEGIGGVDFVWACAVTTIGYGQ